MEPTRLPISAMRVAIISSRDEQSVALKNLIEENGPRVVGTASFKDYVTRLQRSRPDVLLVDLDNADDEALERVDHMIQKSRVPILFNESTVIPNVPGTLRDDWAINLISKLQLLASKEETTTPLLPRSYTRFYDQPLHVAVPRGSIKVWIVTHSKTRRRVLRLILSRQGFRHISEHEYLPELLAYLPGNTHVVVADEHNADADDKKILNQLIAQRHAPVHVCNSSTIPLLAQQRMEWGQILARDIEKIMEPQFSAKIPKKIPKPVAQTPSPQKQISPLNSPAAKVTSKVTKAPTDQHWGDRLALVLAEVRSSIKSNELRYRAEKKTRATDHRITAPSTRIPVIKETVPEDIVKSTEPKSKVVSIKTATKPTLAPTSAFAKPEKQITPPVEQPDPYQDAELLWQYETRSALPEHSEEEMAKLIEELHRDLKYLPPEKNQKQSRKSKITPSPTPAIREESSEIPLLISGDFIDLEKERYFESLAEENTTLAGELIDANNLNTVPQSALPPGYIETDIPTQHSTEEASLEDTDALIQRFLDFDRELNISNHSKKQNPPPTSDFQTDLSNPFAPRRAKVTAPPKAPSCHVKAKQENSRGVTAWLTNWFGVRSGLPKRSS